jgi:hypothetical protein
MIRTENKTRKILYLLWILFFFLFFAPTKVRAEIDATMKTNGDFEFITEDTAASTKITWRTIGFTVRRDKSYGNPLKDDKYATFWIKEKQKDIVKNPDGTVTVTFFLTKAQVNAALLNSNLKEIQDKDVLYINGIFEVKNGYNGPGPYKTLNGIKTAESWRNPDDFNDRFDVKLIYETGNQKYPVTITYQLYQSGTYNTIEKKKVSEIQTHETFQTNSNNIPITQVKNETTYYLYRVYYQDIPNKKVLGNRKTDVNPNIDNDAYENEIKSYVRNRTFYQQAAEEGESLNIVAIYRKFALKQDAESQDEVTKDYEEVDPTGIIGADTRGNEEYEVTDGIPGTETVYANVFSSKYMAGSSFIRKYGKVVYNVRVTVPYNLTWEELNPETKKMGTKHSNITRNYDYQIEREYSYWMIQSLGVYAIDKAIVNNEAFPGGSVTLTPSGYNSPSVSYSHSDQEEDHLIEPIERNQIFVISHSPIAVSGNTIPNNTFKDDAEAAVEQIKCKNDSLVFNGDTIMSPLVKEKKADSPKDIPSGLLEVGENVLYRSNILIPGTMANGEYESTGTIYYRSVAEINASPVNEEMEINDINQIIVHTPTVCDAMIQNNYQDNQMLSPDVSRASLVIDRSFYVTLPTTGYHRNIIGYGYTDYGRYISSREVSFPFDVYKGSSTSGTFIPRNTWTSVAENTQFYMPTWVTEGKYTIQYRSTAINAAANNGYSKTEDMANTDLQNYVATDTTDVEVSGRIYGLNIYDVTDYPIWEKVFRLSNSLKMTGFKYTVGTKDQNGNSNGQDAKYTLTMVNGSHPEYKNQGILKTGYMTRFSLTTVGSMAEKDDYVRIRPKFYYVDKKGNNRQEVDIYYSETFGGKQNVMVKMGGNIDLENDKSIKTGDPYLGIPESELEKTAFFEGVTLQKIKSQHKKVYNFMNIMLPSSLRMYIGTITQIPSGVTAKQVATSVQKWYGEYYLPAEVHIAPKGFDVTHYAINNGGLNYKESFWLKEGYIIVNFDITTVKGGVLNLSYINEKNSTNGYCNMWKKEGYQYQKTSYGGITFNFQDGDYIIYYVNKNVNGDWNSRGTH